MNGGGGEERRREGEWERRGERVSGRGGEERG